MVTYVSPACMQGAYISDQSCVRSCFSSCRILRNMCKQSLSRSTPLCIWFTGDYVCMYTHIWYHRNHVLTLTASWRETQNSLSPSACVRSYQSWDWLSAFAWQFGVNAACCAVLLGTPPWQSIHLKLFSRNHFFLLHLQTRIESATKRNCEYSSTFSPSKEQVWDMLKISWHVYTLIWDLVFRFIFTFQTYLFSSWWATSKQQDHFRGNDHAHAYCHVALCIDLSC
jgi:hypothetical protein